MLVFWMYVVIGGIVNMKEIVWDRFCFGLLCSRYWFLIFDISKIIVVKIFLLLGLFFYGEFSVVSVVVIMRNDNNVVFVIIGYGFCNGVRVCVLCSGYEGGVFEVVEN